MRTSRRPAEWAEGSAWQADLLAVLCAGGKRVGDKGYIVEPTIFADVKDDMDIAKCELPLGWCGHYVKRVCQASLSIWLQTLRVPADTRSLGR